MGGKSRYSWVSAHFLTLAHGLGYFPLTNTLGPIPLLFNTIRNRILRPTILTSLLSLKYAMSTVRMDEAQDSDI